MYSLKNGGIGSGFGPKQRFTSGKMVPGRWWEGGGRPGLIFRSCGRREIKPATSVLEYKRRTPHRKLIKLGKVTNTENIAGTSKKKEKKYQQATRETILKK